MPNNEFTVNKPSLLFCRSGLEQEDMRTLYKYLVTSLFPSTIDLEVGVTLKFMDVLFDLVWGEPFKKIY